MVIEIYKKIRCSFYRKNKIYLNTLGTHNFPIILYLQLFYYMICSIFLYIRINFLYMLDITCACIEINSITYNIKLLEV